MIRWAGRLIALAAVLTPLSPFSTGAAIGATPITQILHLAPGWNLISLTMQPKPSAIPDLFGQFAPRVQRVLAFDGNTQTATWPNERPSLPAAETFYTEATQLLAGRGYWIQVSPGSPVDLAIVGEMPSDGRRTLNAGWHLIGVGNREPRPWHDAFGPIAIDLKALYTYDNSKGAFVGFERPRFVIIPGSAGAVVNTYGWEYEYESGNLRNLSPGAGYWIRLDRPLTFGPVLDIEMEDDIDSWPVGSTWNRWNPDQEDTDINRNGILDYGHTVPGAYDRYNAPVVNTQDTVWLRPQKGSSSSGAYLEQNITILNRGSGILSFEVVCPSSLIEVQPAAGTVLSGTYGRRIALRLAMGHLTAPSSADIAGQMTILSNAGDRTVATRITVPPLLGTYEGYILLTSVNGIAVLPQKVPLLLAFTDAALTIPANPSGRFHNDVHLALSRTGWSFEARGTVQLPLTDPDNHFGVHIIRDVHLKGAFDTGQTTQGSLPTIAGEYSEVLSGLSSAPLTVSGRFRLVPNHQSGRRGP